MTHPQPGTLAGRPGPEDGPAGVLIDNRTGLPDGAVRQAVMSHWVENAGLQFTQPSNFQLYATSQGSNMLSRSPFRTPSNVIDEMKLARQVADTDDDIMATIGSMIAVAFGDGMQNLHEDERTMALFNRICGPVINGGLNMDNLSKELLREYLITGQINTVSLYSRRRYNFTPRGTSGDINVTLSTPRVGVIPSEYIRVMTNDIFGDGQLAYEADGALKEWLNRFFAGTTSNAMKNQMAAEQPVLAALFTGAIEAPYDDPDPFIQGKHLFTLNPRMVHRTTMPKGASPYPRPRLTANFALLEAKRLLNIMDYALLQGGTNYIVVAKVGSDNLPAQQPEVDNLEGVVRAASRTGVLVGPHTLSIDIITPDLTELLNPAKRKLIGRKLAMAMLCMPEQVTGDPGSAGAAQELEFTTRTITSDRRDVKRHIEGFIYEEIAQRNRSTFTSGAPTMWLPKIVLSGIKDYQSELTKARDRGDIPRKWAVEALGLDYESGVAQRKREKASGDDEIMAPMAVPFSGNPQDGGNGRPPGASPSNGRPGGAPGGQIDPVQRQRQLIPRRRGSEPVRAFWDEERAATMRVGQLTEAVLEQYPDHTLGRVSSAERETIIEGVERRVGPTMIVPVNRDDDVTELRAFRLGDGLSMIVGQRTADNALVARALCFREPQFDVQSAEELAMRWGFIEEVVVAGALEDAPEPPEPSDIVANLNLGEVVAQLGPHINVEAITTAFTAILTGAVTQAVKQAVAELPAPAPPPAPQE